MKYSINRVVWNSGLMSHVRYDYSHLNFNVTIFIRHIYEGEFIFYNK